MNRKIKTEKWNCLINPNKDREGKQWMKKQMQRLTYIQQCLVECLRQKLECMDKL